MHTAADWKITKEAGTKLDFPKIAVEWSLIFLVFTYEGRTIDQVPPPKKRNRSAVLKPIVVTTKYGWPISHFTFQKLNNFFLND